MATSWGIDPVLDGNGEPTSGTSSQDVRRIWGGLYSPGVISGCGVNTSATDMTYRVDAGVAVIKTAGTNNTDRQCVMVPVPNTTLTANPNNSSSQRKDIIYVRQQIPGSTNDVVVEVAQGTAVPANAQALATFTASANSSTTSRSYFTDSVPYSVPYGANLGLFFQKIDTSNSNIPKTLTTIAGGGFTLMTDRKCLFTVDLNVSALRPNGTRAYRFDDSAYVELLVEVHIDGTRQFVFNTPGLHQAWSTFHFEEYVNLKSGPHAVTFKYFYSDIQGPGLVRRHYSGENAATGCTFSVRDAGFWESGVSGDTV